MLSKSEREIMKLLWEVGEPLTCVNIIERAGEKTWKDSYIHIMIRSLIKKDMIKVDGFELVSKSYARKFAPTMSREEYAIKEIADAGMIQGDSAVKLVTALVSRVEDKELLSKIKAVLDDREAQLC